MTAALCTNCGGIKMGLLLPCDHCGASPPKALNYEIFLSDHYLSLDTLKQFGRVIKRLKIVANDKLEAQWAFLFLLSEYHPEIMFTDVPIDYKTSSKILLKDLYLDPIIMKKGSYKADPLDPESKYATVVDYSQTNCPYCGVKKSVAVWKLFNGYSDATLLPVLFEGRIFRSRCLKCQKIQSVHYDMVYFDIEPMPVIIYLDHPKADPEYRINHVPKEYFDELKEEFSYRKVTRPVDLIEKIQIFKDEVDDIEVEIAKHFLSIDAGMDLSNRLQYQEIKKSVLRKNQFIFKDHKNEMGEITYPINEKRKLKGQLKSLMREEVNKKGNEWPVVNHKNLLGSFDKAKN